MTFTGRSTPKSSQFHPGCFSDTLWPEASQMASLRTALSAALLLAFCVPVSGADDDPRLGRLRKLTPRPDIRKWLNGQTVTAQPQSGTEPAVPDRCAHIIVHQPPADLDKGLLKKFGADTSTDRMPDLGAVPVCPQDIRPLPKK